MPKNPDYQTIKTTLCQIIDKLNKRGGTLQAETILSSALDQICNEHGGRRSQNEKVLKRAWGDLLRNGEISLGIGISNMSPSFFEVTDKGNETFEYLNKDPGSPKGYLEHLSKKAKIDHVAKSYLCEALKTYNADCFKASAVMLGCASERLILNLRDILVKKIESAKGQASKKLVHRQISKVMDRIENELNQKKKQFPKDLSERYERYWSFLAHVIRITRNEAGHPINIESIKKPEVHLAFENFAYLIKLNKELEEWILNNW